MPATLDFGVDMATPVAMGKMASILAGSYSIKERVAGQVILINKTSPIDRTMTVKYQSREVPDVYKGTNINPVVMSPNRTGRNVATVVSVILKSVAEDGDVEYLPIKATLSLTIPNNAVITKDVIGKMLSLAIDSWTYGAEWRGKDEPTWDRAFSLCKGALEPDLTR